ncbi:MAG: 2-amino-4-hydroxy-6-hydroxymethyldihydropteridine diphosphokinase [Candidatus Sumerlaeota bacterium]|nr:2-amino-4-hydroxy-6-hydroxymethyldihydropteridine diphosphokinase [Candidatus Sumerlaeota bacterium]
MPPSDASFPHWAAVGLGSNLNDPEAMLTRARVALDALEGVDVLAASPLYRSEPWGDRDQPEFRNAVVVLRTAMSAEALLDRMAALEDSLGKRPVRRWGPRAIDLDLLLYDDATISGNPRLVVPHPHIRSRPFVCHPLREASAGLAVPASWHPQGQLNAEGEALDGETARLDGRSGWPLRAVGRESAFSTQSPEETSAVGEVLGRAAQPPLIVALDGPLGAGKSCLARGIARGLGIEGPVPSPTYTLCREYETLRGPFLHWDFYRLEGGGDLESTAFHDRLADPALHVIEWAGLFAEELPARQTVWLHLDPDGDRRRISCRFPAGQLALRAALFQHLPGGAA